MRKAIACLVLAVSFAGLVSLPGCDSNPGGPSAPSVPKDGAPGASAEGKGKGQPVTKLQ